MLYLIKMNQHFNDIVEIRYNKYQYDTASIL